MFIYNTSFGIGDVSGRFADSTEPQFSKCSSMSTIPASNKNELQLLSGLGSRSRFEPGVFVSLEPEPSEKKPGVGATLKKTESEPPKYALLYLTKVKSRDPKEPHVFGPLEMESEPLENKMRSRSCLQNKLGAGAGAA